MTNPEIVITAPSEYQSLSVVTEIGSIAAYAALDTPYDRRMSSIDYGIGKILEKIELEKTIIVITSDHGSLIPFENVGFTDFEPSFKRELNIGKKLI